MDRHPGLTRWLSLPAGAALACTLLGCYRYRQAYPGTYTAAVAAVDLDGDGRTDLLGANQPAWGGGFVTARLQDPSRPGGLGPPLRSAAGSGPASLAVMAPGGTVVVINQTAWAGSQAANSVSVLLPGTAPGTFQAPMALALGARVPWDAAVGSLGPGGGADVAVAADGGSDLLVFFQAAGAGSYGPPVSLAVGGVPTAVTMADLNGDGLADLAVATAGNLVSVLLQDPAHPGSFLAHVDYAAGSAPVAVRAAALGGGLPDLIVADYGSASAPTTLGLGILAHDPARPGAFLPLASYDVGDYLSCSVAVGDLDGDGRPDVAVANLGLPGTPGSVSVLFQGPGGSLGSPVVYGGAYGPSSVAIGDFNGDGLADLAIADGGAAIRFQLAGQPGVFGPEVGYAQ